MRHALVVATLVAVLAACGGGGAGSTTTSTSTTTTTVPPTTTTELTTTTVALAPPLPDFVGWSRDDAYAWLEENGLAHPGHVLRIDDDPDIPDYEVLGQSHPEGSILPLGTEVTIISKDSSWCAAYPEECDN